MTLWQENLTRLIDLIDELLPEEREANGMYQTYDEFRANQAEAKAVLDTLIRTEAARYRQGDADSLRMAGVTTSCTSGHFGLLRNWQDAARRKLGKAAS